MFHYKFPEIRIQNDVWKFLKGDKQFYLRENAGYNVINYVVSTDETFPEVTDLESAIRRECRGITFAQDDGRILRRPYQKFFNVGEKDEISLDKIDISKGNSIILEELDGSMIAPFIVNHEMIWGTKMGKTDVGEQAQEFVSKHGEYYDLAEYYIGLGYTPIFEWCSRQNRIVIDHPKDQLVLTGMRHMITGTYSPQEVLEELGEYYSVPVVQTWNESPKSIEALRDYTKGLTDIEGFVVRFDDGQMVKLKADSYCAIHRAKEFLSREIYVVRLIMDDKADDLIPIIPELDQERLKRYLSEFDLNLLETTDKLEAAYKEAKKMSRKDFAISSSGMNPYLRDIIFHNWDNEDIHYTLWHDLFEDLQRTIKKNIQSGERFSKIKKHLFPNITWNEVPENE